MEEELTELMKGFNRKIGSDPNNPTPLNMHKVFTASVLNILWSMMSGLRFSHEDERLQKFFLTLSDVMTQFNVSGNIFVAFPFLLNILPALTGYGSVRKGFVTTVHKQFRVR
jgi:hypothetical protein